MNIQMATQEVYTKPRRANGEGTIYQRGDKWVGQIQLGYKKNGKPNRLTVTGKSRPEVVKKLNALQMQYQLGTLSQDEKKSVFFSEFAREYIMRYKRTNLKENSFTRVMQTFEYQVIPTVGDFEIEQITQDDVQDMVNQLVEEDYSYSSIKKALNLVNEVLEYAADNDIIRKNPAKGIKLPKELKDYIKQICYYTSDQLELITAEAIRQYSNGTPVYRLGYLIPLLASTGMRIGELLALEWADIDFDKELIHIYKSITWVKRSGKRVAQISSTKTANSKRFLKMNSKAKEALLKLREITGDSKYIAVTSTGKHIHPRNIDRMFRSICKKLKLETAGVHSLRHSFASNLIMRGVNIKIVSELLGHCDIDITLKTYVHILEEYKAEAMQVIDNVY